MQADYTKEAYDIVNGGEIHLLSLTCLLLAGFMDCMTAKNPLILLICIVA